MKALSFQGWQAMMLAERDNKIVKCPECNGSGILYEDCFHCGHETEEDCGSCDGEGRVNMMELDPETLKKKVFTHDAYLESLEADVIKVWRFTGRIVDEPLRAEGFVPCQILPSRAPTFVPASNRGEVAA